jgi:hypothetical protein
VSWNRDFRVQACQFVGDGFVYPAFSELGGYAYRVLYGVGVRRSVSDDADAFHSEERGSAIFGVVEALFEI